jgi:hypothetical protein
VLDAPSNTWLLHGAGYYLKSWLSLSLSNSILLSLWNPKVHYRVHKSPPLDSVLSQPKEVTLITVSCFLHGTRRFITVFTKARHWTLSLASWIQFPIPNTNGKGEEVVTCKMVIFVALLNIYSYITLTTLSWYQHLCTHTLTFLLWCVWQQTNCLVLQEPPLLSSCLSICLALQVLPSIFVTVCLCYLNP